MAALSCLLIHSLPHAANLSVSLCSIHLNYGLVRIADLGGDAKSLLVGLSNGTLQVFSWQGKVRMDACWAGTCIGSAGQ